ncbi:MAG: T9SS type A sorting domain-containing protein, partial [Flavobacteriales bacterium]
KLKVMVTLPFESGTEGLENISTQVFTYNLDESNFEISNFPFVGTPISNPNYNGSLPLEENLTFNAKNWTMADHSIYGGPSNSIRPSAFNEIAISGNQTKSSDVTSVEMRAQNEIIVSGDVLISDGFTLALHEFVHEIPIPAVDQTFIAAYCASEQPNGYNANAPRNATVSTNNFANVNYQKKIDANIQLAAYPNPTTSTLNLSLLNFSGQVQFDIYNAIGNKLQSFSKTLDGSRSMNYLACSTDDLPNGTYTIVARMADGTSTTEQFVVLR